ncbi:MAG TPA: response regulator, partial [Nitrospira sp.]|nr:response regulator [Nitrospira sp.]
MTAHAHILVVEDEVNIRSALVTMLEKLGHRVSGAGTAEEALALLEDSPADLVITDLRMPGL